ncbi:MAG: Re/Si-specific NAD(P)(+) transhydrogenase subunit alpha [Candidatus Omnitrophica bacterium]|nr:Re/Si-specific NAD(P)(+) transhydrogenase subunit alpha [Candidatus Omnitrophota bacterium]
MKVGIPKETQEHERRVAATPETVKKFIGAGFSVAVQSSAGEYAHISDAEFQTSGAEIVTSAQALFGVSDIILKVQRPSNLEIALMKEGATLISFLYPLVQTDTVLKLSNRKLTAFAIDLIPRIARAQKMDALSSQSNVAGYKAVLMAADALGKFMPLLMTAAGTISPAKVLVIGAGVAGLQAIATARRLGAVVEAFDTRPVVKEQVESLGARFIEIPLADKNTEDPSGYAKELSKESHEVELRVIGEHVKVSDIVITTALIPGKRAPLLITEEMVQHMKKGSVIVDLAAEAGGNCALTKPGEEVIQLGVKIIGRFNVPSLLAGESSRLYARNIMHLVLEISKGGKLELKREDEVVQGTLILSNGEIVHPQVKGALGKAEVK